MRKIFTICMTCLLTLLLFQACTEEKLVTINDPLELDENSIQYQQYMEERAIQLIKEYRFDQLGNTIDRIKDPVVREQVLTLLKEYRMIAFNEALYLAKPTNDTVFFFPPNISDRETTTRIYIPFELKRASTIPNERGILHGFKNFPKVEIVEFVNSMASGIKDLNLLPELKTFNWTFQLWLTPDVEITPQALAFDFSQNEKLETVNLQYLEMANLKFSAKKIKGVSLSSVIIKSSEEIDAIAANQLGVRGSCEPEVLTLKSQNIDSLNLELAGLNNLDVSATNLLKLQPGALTKVKLNEGLQKLQLISADKLTEKPNFPESLQSLELYNYQLSDKNFSGITDLKYLSISCPGFDGLALPNNIEEVKFGAPWPYSPEYASGINQDYSKLTRWKKVTINTAVDQTGLVFPANLEQLNFDIPNGKKITGVGDYTNISSLKTFIGKSVDFEYAPKLPTSLLKIDLYSFNLPEGGTFDLSNLTHLEYLRLFTYDTNPFTLILPENLTEDAIKAAYGGINQYHASIILPTGSTIVNAPDWLSKYVYIGSIW